MKIKTRLAIAIFATAVAIPAPVLAQHAYAGVWRHGTGGYALHVGNSWTDFISNWNALGTAGLRLIDLETDVPGAERVFSGVWEQGTDAYALEVGLDWAAFIARWGELARTNLRLIDFETFDDGAGRVFAGVWREGTDGYALEVGLQWTEFETRWIELAAQGLRLIDIEIFDDGGPLLYAGVWREGTDGYALWVGDTWQGFEDMWVELGSQGLRLIDLETYLVNDQRRYAGVWRQGSDAYGLWAGCDFEGFVGRWYDWAQDDLRLIDIERYPGCSAECANRVVAPDSYNYLVTGDTWYRWPVVSDGGVDYVRMSAVHFDVSSFLELPYDDPAVNRYGTWLYSEGSWHHAIDYGRSDATTFELLSAAAGQIVFQGWDTWSGNTVIVSHTVDGEPDAFRTLYMHVRNGASNDCDRSWTDTVPTISGSNLTEFKQHLNDTGCTQDVTSRNLDPDHWGTEGQMFPLTVGQVVSAGQFIAWAGNTGPGGKRGPGGPNTHLHFFVTRRDPTDNQYYFIDPYGIYSVPGCYPSTPGGIASGPCARYPNIWGHPGLMFHHGFEWGDLTGWSQIRRGR